MRAPPDEPRWLDDDEQATWRALLATYHRLFAVLDRQLRVDSGITHAYYMILVVLSEAPGRSLTMSELAGMLESSPSRLSHAVARLEEAGWVRREKLAHDRRTTRAVLTDAGIAVLVGAAPGHAETVRRGVFDPLTPEQVRQLGEICDAVLSKLNAEPAD
jgi:DNA-binding MarR family transcriptional regulator